jgi:DNA-binding CsgD family transcriptional regulator
VPISLAIVAESVSNALRAYGLGMHLDRFTVNVYSHPVSLAGSVLVLAAVAVSLTQARAAWVALRSGVPWVQRLVAGFAALLLLAISITAMASHILEAQRAKVADDGGSRGRYDRAKAAYDKADAELTNLGNPRAVSVIQAEVAATKIDMGVWRRSQQCSDVTREDTRSACEPVLALYKERGAAARKAELGPEVSRLRDELASLTRPEETSISEATVSLYWAWIMGVGVVFVATFGSVIFATATPSIAEPKADVGVPVSKAALTFEKPLTPDEIEELRRLILGAGRPLSNQEIARQLSISPSEASKRVSEAVRLGVLHRRRAGREVAITLH